MSVNSTTYFLGVGYNFAHAAFIRYERFHHIDRKVSDVVRTKLDSISHNRWLGWAGTSLVRQSILKLSSCTSSGVRLLSLLVSSVSFFILSGKTWENSEPIVGIALFVLPVLSYYILKAKHSRDCNVSSFQCNRLEVLEFSGFLMMSAINLISVVALRGLSQFVAGFNLLANGWAMYEISRRKWLNFSTTVDLDKERFSRVSLFEKYRREGQLPEVSDLIIRCEIPARSVTSEQQKEDNCAVCLESLKGDDTPISACSNNHFYHQRCLNGFTIQRLETIYGELKTRMETLQEIRCPTCRKKLTDRVNIEVFPCRGADHFFYKIFGISFSDTEEQSVREMTYYLSDSNPTHTNLSTPYLRSYRFFRLVMSIGELFTLFAR